MNSIISKDHAKLSDDYASVRNYRICYMVMRDLADALRIIHGIILRSQGGFLRGIIGMRTISKVLVLLLLLK